LSKSAPVYQSIFAEVYICVRLSAAQNNEDCDKAKEYYIRAGNSNDLQEKLSNYLEAARLCPKSGKVRNNLSDTYERLGRFNEAIEGYKLAITLYKDLPDTPFSERAIPYFGLGDVYLQTGQFRGAIEAYTNGLKLAPDNEYTRRNLKEAKRNLIQDVGMIEAEEIVHRLSESAINVMGPQGIRKRVRRVACPTILFATDKATLRKESYGQLEEISRALTTKNLESCRFIIEGHTDNRGTFRHNMGLSYDRAASVQTQLTNHYKLSADRFEIRAFGYTRPRESNDTDWGQRQNRRVEFVLVK